MRTPSADELRVARLGECAVESPLAATEAHLTPDERYVVIPETSEDLAEGWAQLAIDLILHGIAA